MQESVLQEMVKRIQKLRCETQTIEVKAAHEGCPKRLYDTLSSFSNQDSGGVIIFGLDESQHFQDVGVYDAQDLQKHVTEQCNEMEPPVRALFTVTEMNGHTIVSAEIPGVDISERPVFYKGVGRVRGSFIRVGDADEQMSEYETYSYDAFRKRIREDLRVVEGGKSTLLQADKLSEYVLAVKKDRPNLAQIPEQDIYELMGIMTNGQPTMAGLLTFSAFPQGYFPQLCITAVCIPGTQIGDTDSDAPRFVDNQRITGSIPQMLEAAVAFVYRNMKHRTIITSEGKRADKDEYPLKAVREAILNALVHRDYSIHSENVPIRIEMYSNRMEIINSGGLYGRITIDSLGNVRPDTRNAALANILETLHITENRYSGIPTIRKAMQDAGLPAPKFEVRRGEFRVTFENQQVNEQEQQMDIAYPRLEELLRFCETPRNRSELMEFTGYSRYYTIAKIVQPLIDAGLLTLAIPDKPKSKKQKYVAIKSVTQI